MLSMNTGSKRNLLGSSQLIPGTEFRGTAYCVSSFSRLSKSNEPFIVFNLKGIDNVIRPAYIFGATSQSAGATQQSVTHRFVDVVVKVDVYGNRLSLVLESIEVAKDITESDRLLFKGAVPRKELEKGVSNVKEIFGELYDSESKDMEKISIPEKFLSLSVDDIDGGMVGAPFMYLVNILKRISIIFEGKGNLRTYALLTTFYAYKKYLKYKLIQERGNNYSELEILQLATSFKNNVGNLDSICSETVLELMNDNNQSKHVVASVVAMEIRNAFDYAKMFNEWENILYGGEAQVYLSYRKNRFLRKY